MEGIGNGLSQSSQNHHCQDDAHDWRNLACILLLGEVVMEPEKVVPPYFGTVKSRNVICSTM